MTTYSDEAMRRVQLGVAWLDQARPGWEHRVTLPEFDIASICDCVLGQVFAPDASRLNGNRPFPTHSGWNVAMDVATGSPDTNSEDRNEFAILHGFDSGHGVGYADLQLAWAEVIEERQRVLAEA